MNITEFLEARIAEDEAAARRAAEVFPGSWDIEDRGHHAHVVCDGPNFHYVSELDQKQAPEVDWLGGALQNIANYQPARVLAECAAKRAILNIFPLPGKNSTYGWVERDIVHALAAAYNDHPDFLAEWAL